MAGDPTSFQPVIDYIEKPSLLDSEMGRKLSLGDTSAIIPTVMALYGRIQLTVEVRTYLWPHGFSDHSRRTQ